MSFTDGSFNFLSSGANCSITGFAGVKSSVISLVIPSTATDGTNTFNVNIINNSALGGFSNATSITIPDSITSIGQAGFLGCTKLTNIIMNPTSQLGGNLYTTFRSATSLVNVIIYGNATALIGTFEDCTSLINCSVPSTITSINSNTFNAPSRNLILNWTSLTNLTTIAVNAFSCGIQDVIIPSSVTSIAGLAFSNCNFLKTVTFLGEKIPITMPSNAFTGSTIPNNCICFIQRGTSRADITRLETIFGIGYVLYEISICFKENTKILTDKGYIPIEKLRKGDLVKTLLHGYVPINCIGKKVIYHNNSDERTKDKLYKCSSTEFPEIFEPLILTGCHSILVENSIEVVNEEQIKKVIEINGNIYLTDGKLRLPACVDERTSIFETSGNYTIYHIALEHEDEYMNYGIYANGLLVESCSEWSMKEFSNLSIVE